MFVLGMGESLWQPPINRAPSTSITTRRHPKSIHRCLATSPLRSADAAKHLVERKFWLSNFPMALDGCSSRTTKPWFHIKPEDLAETHLGFLSTNRVRNSPMPQGHYKSGKHEVDLSWNGAYPKLHVFGEKTMINRWILGYSPFQNRKHNLAP